MRLLFLMATVIAAGVLVVSGATMNALFLSAFGRTPAETGLLAAVSLAIDLAKVAMPNAIARSIATRAWTHLVRDTFVADLAQAAREEMGRQAEKERARNAGRERDA